MSDEKVTGTTAQGKGVVMKHNLKLWHYTVFINLQKIVEAGYIQPATMYVGVTEKPVVWLSSNKHWEQTVRKVIRSPDGTETKPLSINGLTKYGMPCVRLEINLNEVEVHPWRHFKRLTGAKREVVKELGRAAIRWGAVPSQWYFSLAPIPLNACPFLEFWTGKRWLEVTEENLQLTA